MLGRLENGEQQSAARLSVVTLTHDREVLMALRGDLDLQTAPELERELLAVRTADSVLVDLEQVGFVDLSGMRPLVRFAQSPPPRPQLRITLGSRPVQTLLRLSGLADQFTVLAGFPQ